MGNKTKILEEWIRTNASKESFDVNQVVLCSDTWSKQCVEAVANDFACTDSMLELDRMLEDDVFTLPQYIKQLRKLAREQFMHRALARVVYEKQNAAVCGQHEMMSVYKQSFSRHGINIAQALLTIEDVENR